VWIGGCDDEGDWALGRFGELELHAQCWVSSIDKGKLIKRHFVGFEVRGLEDLEASLLADEAAEARSKLVDARCTDGYLQVKYEAATVLCGGYSIKIGIYGAKLLGFIRQNFDGEVHLSRSCVEPLIADMDVSCIRVR